MSNEPTFLNEPESIVSITSPEKKMERLRQEIDAMNKIYEAIKDFPCERALKILKAAAILHDIPL